MALIKCPECNKQVSDKAVACPNCGFPIKDSFEKKTIDEKFQDELDGDVQCPYCEAKDIDNDGYCNNCGMKILNHKDINNCVEENDNINVPYTVCPKCGHKNETGKFTCEKCLYKYKMSDYNVVIPDEYIENTGETSAFNGVYRHGLLGKVSEVYCPRCNSSECSHYKEQKTIPSKTKISYTMNLNPLRPFTLINKREKIVRKEQNYTEDKFICNKCGKIFY